MQVKACIVLTAAFFVQGCASAYKGPQPDLRLTGAAARAEAAKFELDEGEHFEGRGAWFDMGPKRERFTISSLRPTIEAISPEANQTIAHAEGWRLAQYASLGLALTAGVLAAASTDKDTANPFAAAALLSTGAVVGIGFVYGSLLSSAAIQFNRDLRRSFRTALGLNFSY